MKLEFQADLKIDDISWIEWHFENNVKFVKYGDIKMERLLASLAEYFSFRQFPDCCGSTLWDTPVFSSPLPTVGNSLG